MDDTDMLLPYQRLEVRQPLSVYDFEEQHAHADALDRFAEERDDRNARLITALWRTTCAGGLALTCWRVHQVHGSMLNTHFISALLMLVLILALLYVAYRLYQALLSTGTHRRSAVRAFRTSEASLTADQFKDLRQWEKAHGEVAATLHAWFESGLYPRLPEYQAIAAWVKLEGERIDYNSQLLALRGSCRERAEVERGRPPERGAAEVRS